MEMVRGDYFNLHEWDGSAEPTACLASCSCGREVNMYRKILSLTWVVASGLFASTVALAEDTTAVKVEAPAEEAPVDNVAVANQLRLLGAVIRSDTDGSIVEVSFAASKTEEDVTIKLKGLVKLQVLDLTDKKVDDEGLKNLAGLKNIEILVLMRTKITDAGLAHLAGMNKMIGLDLSGTEVKGSGLEHMQQMPDLSDLCLDRTQIADEHLVLVTKIPHLQSVSLIGAKQVTTNGLTKLKRANPKLVVVR
jgi:hypothetical protein